MAVVINEVEQLPLAEPSRPTDRGGADEGGPQARRGMQADRVMAAIRREASRAARLWAD